MENIDFSLLNKEATEKTPGISYDADTQKLSIGGRCIDHNIQWGEYRTAIKALCAHNLLKELSFTFEYCNEKAKYAISRILDEDTRLLPEATLDVERKYESDDASIQEAGEIHEAITQKYPHIKTWKNIEIVETESPEYFH